MWSLTYRNICFQIVWRLSLIPTWDALLCDFLLADGNKGLFTPDKVLIAHQRDNSTLVQLSEPMSVLGWLLGACLKSYCRNMGEGWLMKAWVTPVAPLYKAHPSMTGELQICISESPCPTIGQIYPRQSPSSSDGPLLTQAPKDPWGIL